MANRQSPENPSELTPEMSKAGIEAFYLWYESLDGTNETLSRDEVSDLVSAVFTAMRTSSLS